MDLRRLAAAMFFAFAAATWFLSAFTLGTVTKGVTLALDGLGIGLGLAGLFFIFHVVTHPAEAVASRPGSSGASSGAPPSPR